MKCTNCKKKRAIKSGLCPYCYYQLVSVDNETINDKEKRAKKGNFKINGDKLNR